MPDRQWPRCWRPLWMPRCRSTPTSTASAARSPRRRDRDGGPRLTSAGAVAGGRLPCFHPECVEVFPMTTTPSPIRGLSRWAASAAGLLRIYFLPLVVSALVATVWLMVVVAATEATGSVLLVLPLVALPGIVAKTISRVPPARSAEDGLVWLLYFAAIPAYGVVLLIGGYTLVAARAWRRHRPHVLQPRVEGA